MNEQEPTKQPEKKPDEVGGIAFSSVVVITDPETKEILVRVRGD